MLSRLMAAACAATICLLSCPPADANPLKIRMDWSTVPGHFAPLIPTVPNYAPNVYRHYGKSYIVEPIRLQGAGTSLTALAADQIDVSGILGPLTLVTGVTEAKLNIRVIGQAMTTELPGYLFTHFWVRADEIKSLQDLKGKVIAITARGGNVDAAVQVLMKRNGMLEYRDYQIAEVRFPAMIAALESKRVDAGPLVPPFDRMAGKIPALKPLFSVGDAFGPVETLMFMAKADYVAKNRAALVDFLEDNIRMRQWMLDPKSRMDAIKQLSDFTKIPVDQYAEWNYSSNDYFYHPKAFVDVPRLQKNIETLREAGLLTASMDVQPFIDQSLVTEAAARVKE